MAAFSDAGIPEIGVRVAAPKAPEHTFHGAQVVSVAGLRRGSQSRNSRLKHGTVFHQKCPCPFHIGIPLQLIAWLDRPARRSHDTGSTRLVAGSRQILAEMPNNRAVLSRRKNGSVDQIVLCRACSFSVAALVTKLARGRGRCPPLIKFVEGETGIRSKIGVRERALVSLRSRLDPLGRCGPGYAQRQPGGQHNKRGLTHFSALPP